MLIIYIKKPRYKNCISRFKINKWIIKRLTVAFFKRKRYIINQKKNPNNKY